MDKNEQNPTNKLENFNLLVGVLKLYTSSLSKKKEVDTVKVKPKKEKVKLIKDTVKIQPKTPKVKKELPTPFIGTSLGIGIDYYQYTATRLKGN